MTADVVRRADSERIYGTSSVTITIRGKPFNAWDDLIDYDVRFVDPPGPPRLGQRVHARVDAARSNGGSYGLPSYTSRRFAPPSWPRELVSVPRAAPTPARARHARDATKRRKRSRDFARTGRRTPWLSR